MKINQILRKGRHQVDEEETPQEESGDDDAALDEFVSEWEALKEKVGRIPDDIGDQLAEISSKLGGGGSSGAAKRTATTQPSGATGVRSTGQGQTPRRTQQAEAAPAREPDKQPKSQHWYYRERRRRDA